MTAKTYSSAVIGIEAVPVEVEVDLSPGLHAFNIVGLPNKTVEEAKDRVSSALKNIGASPPQKNNRRVVVNLAPADLKKQGSNYDLAIALSYLLASGQMKDFGAKRALFLGELSLSGNLKKITGVLPAALMAKKMGFQSLFVPEENAGEASLVKGLAVFGLENLKQAVDFLEGKIKLKPFLSSGFEELVRRPDYAVSLSEIKGQQQAKRALMISAAGAHNLLMSGPPGSGKTMLAKALPSILPNLCLEESLEIAQIYSVCGLLGNKNSLVLKRPFRAPHHSASSAALVGGGAWPKPGEVSLAHRGVLFLDEAAEFQRSVLEALRQPLEDGEISVSRAQARICFPAKFILVAAVNPCPCGFLGDDEKECDCAPKQIVKYRKRISGPLLDRLDIQIQVKRIKFRDFQEEKVSLEKVREKIDRAREIQKKRFAGVFPLIFTNGEMSSVQTEKFCFLDEDCKSLLEKAVDKWHLSGRGYFRVLKTARTIADLEESEKISSGHIAEALGYRIKGDD